MIDAIIEIATYEFKDRISSLEGFPVNDIILYSWFNVELPGNIGFPMIIYPRIQPILHISADF